MKISTKFGGIMLSIVLLTGFLMIFTINSLSSISGIISEHRDRNTPLMITSLSLQKDIIQIQQWLTDISATRGMPGFDDGFDMASDYYNSAKDKIKVLRELGVETELADTISNDLDEFYQTGIEMANTYIDEGTDAGNIFMDIFDPYAARIEDSVGVLLNEADEAFNNGNSMIVLSINDLYQKSIILFGIVILISILSFFIIQNLVIKRLKTMTGIFKDISEGEGDLTKRVDVKSKDEIGSMAVYFNNFSDTIHRIVSTVKEVSEKVSRASEELTDNSHHSAAAAEEVAQTIDEIAKGATSQAENTVGGSEELMHLGELIEENKRHIEVFMQLSSRINGLVSQGLNIIDKLTLTTEESSSAANSVYQSIMKTNKSSEKISEASSLITSIAEQTNLLALNAAIEAARAGEHGKGFAVVAEEIRKLAEESTDSTKVIDDMIKNLRQDAAQAVEIMKRVEKILKEQFESVSTTESKYREIAEEMDKSKETVQTINQTGIQMEQKKNGVLDTIQMLSSIAEENAAATEQVSASIQEQTASIEKIANASESLSELFRELHSTIERFKV
jgi:methyl-accepting chemotaxis protein